MEEIKQSLIHIITHVEKPSESPRELRKFSKVAVCKINEKKWIAFLYTNNEQSEVDI